jgi:lipoprotein-anchoring transpeptidase ErfK/SrfK
MVLNSQMARPDTLRRFATTRRRSNRLRNTGIVGLLACGIAWAAWPSGAALNTTLPEAPAKVDKASIIGGPTDADMNPRADLRAQQQRLIADAAAQEAYLAKLKGEAKPASASPVEIARFLEAPAPVKPPGKAARAGTAGTPDTASKAAPVIRSEKPLATAPKVEAAPADSFTLASAAPGKPTAAAIAPAVSEMVGRLTFTTPAGSAGTTLREGMSQIADGKLVEGRKTLSRVLTAGDPSVTAADAQAIRDTLASVNKSLIFSDKVVENDPLVETHVIASGELLSVVARKYKMTYQFLEQINGVDAKRIRVGQKIKAVKGPFHVVVDKSDFRMDIYIKEADNAMIYITSFPVGVGKDDSTPIGSFICKPGGKLENPSWTHPRTGKFYAGDDAENPIGEYWIALQGTDDHTKAVRGYGIHGTIEPASVGKQASLGCVRMLAKDIEQVYKLLVDGQSTVVIQP